MIMLVFYTKQAAVDAAMDMLDTYCYFLAVRGSDKHLLLLLFVVLLQEPSDDPSQQPAPRLVLCSTCHSVVTEPAGDDDLLPRSHHALQRADSRQ